MKKENKMEGIKVGMLKKLCSLAMVAIMITTLITGCSSGNGKDSKKDGEKEKLVLWMPPVENNMKEVWDPILDKFEEKNNCEVDLQIIPWDNYSEKFATAISAGEGPDVGYMYAEMYPQFIESGAVEDLTNYATKEDKEQSIYIKTSEMMGGMYGMPFQAANPGVLYYNKDILEKLGEKPPKTWEDFKRICKKATQDTDGDGKIDQWGLAQGWGAKTFGNLNWNWYPYLWQAGGDIFNDDLKSVKFNDKSGLEAANFLKELQAYVPEDSLSKDSNEMIESVFGPGKAAFTIMLSSAATSVFDESFPDLNWGFVTGLEDKKAATFGAVDHLSLMSSAKNKELAYKLIQHMLSVESMTEFHKAIPRAPITKGEPYQGDERFKEMVENDKNVYRPLVVGPHGVEIYEYLWKELQTMISGDKTPKQALDDAAKYSNDLLAQ
ncbi:TPA: ABC transporter substrate-binding protein [Clostridioides difficile]|uniref:ABC transporter substrate-binding protein n=1 Tax=Clostridioides difficile TaxID=1496 RepID=UPI0013EF925C|nr:sugar ABC transporter substrate-binding protein [Clostridioides difficile]MBH7210813.1 sugar ABC transporter substrate-binding protein [Clostridioides difficile]MBZ0820958.1 sugar ABC transporter substrate-binding protein [Clostridioides difficile]HBF0233265.1 sugar ABC transporter substrate-binding protein [Clostridioides difficile]HBF4425952.1 sugar ABC transporter substrate-binding protein [Clostridioides difficile]HBF5450637.1 sugar ABC transporter substrate-binding protein [Clostridioi